MTTSLADVVFSIGRRLAPRGGTYVEAGANDGIRQSNSLMLSRSGWRGVLIEPSPAVFSDLRRNRPHDVLVECALVADESTTTVVGTFESGSLMGSADTALSHLAASPSRFRGESRLRRALGLSPRGSISVPGRTLASVLSEVAIDAVDLLSLDLEGQELDALIGLGDMVRPRVIIVETRRRDALAQAELLLERGYMLASNLSRFSRETHPAWSGNHQDLAWCPREDQTALAAVLGVVD